MAEMNEINSLHMPENREQTVKPRKARAQMGAQAQAAWQSVCDGLVPEAAYQPYRSQCHSAKRRGIPMQFTIVEWWTWWQTDGRWERRGLKGNGLVMARMGDSGPYHPDNVYCATNGDNVSDIAAGRMSAARSKSWAKKKAAGGRSHLCDRKGDAHPASKAIITPDGRFPSTAAAAKHYGLSQMGAVLRARKQQKGWRYETP